MVEGDLEILVLCLYLSSAKCWDDSLTKDSHFLGALSVNNPPTNIPVSYQEMTVTGRSQGSNGGPLGGCGEFEDVAFLSGYLKY